MLMHKPPPPNTLVQATGWYRNAQGNIQLVALQINLLLRCNKY
ncbi:hypothetical protein [Plectonema radiosum]|nr:hypothetical protein [Plectonema radiosum]